MQPSELKFFVPNLREEQVTEESTGKHYPLQRLVMDQISQPCQFSFQFMLDSSFQKAK